MGTPAAVRTRGDRARRPRRRHRVSRRPAHLPGPDAGRGSLHRLTTDSPGRGERVRTLPGLRRLPGGQAGDRRWRPEGGPTERVDRLALSAYRVVACGARVFPAELGGPVWACHEAVESGRYEG